MSCNDDIIARNLHELIMLDLNEIFKDEVEFNKAEKWGPFSDEPVCSARDEFDFEEYFKEMFHYGQTSPARHRETASYYHWVVQGDTLHLRKKSPVIQIESESGSESESESEDELPPPPKRAVR